MSNTLAGESASPLVSSLRNLFAQASLLVSLAGLADAERNRDVAFYDETLVAAIRLSIPASDKTLPFPSAESPTSFSLPLKASIDDEDDEEGYSEKPPKLLLLLISALQISLESSYTAPRLGSLAGTASNQPEASTSSNYLIPVTQDRDAAYQNVPSQRNSNNGEVTEMFTTSWNGIGIPNESVEKEEGKKVRLIRQVDGEEEEEDTVRGGGEIWYVEDAGIGRWITEWRCKLPIIFMRTRHPTPALILTALMTLRLQPSHLGRLAPLLAPSTITSASESLYLHDLLNPLSEGPSYPDESPAERAARANASLAKLPLGKLPSSVLGSKLVTPARNAKEVGQIISSKQKKNATENGDMGDANDNGRVKASRGGRRILTNEGLMAFQLDLTGSVSSLSDDQAKGLGEEVIVLQRSARKVLDVQSAILVRMRTITVSGFQGSEDQIGENTLLPTLVLCVEVENPANSGMRFSMDQVDVLVTMPPSQTSSTSSGNNKAFDVSMRRIGEVSEPLLVEQGSQNNLLYQMSFDCPVSEDGTEEGIMKALIDSHRNISIKILGRPVLLREKDGKVEFYTPTKKFLSTWTCTLDLSPQMRMVALQRVMHNGAGGNRFGGNVRERQPPQRIGSTSNLTPHTASNYLANLALPASPSSPLPRTPTEIQSASRSMTPIQASPSQRISLRRPSMRSASETTQGGDNAFVSLQRSELDRQDPTSPSLPALSSALVGQSILARAKMNRSATLSSFRAEDGRPLMINNGKEAKLRNASDRTVTPTQQRGTFPYAFRKPMEAASGGGVNGLEEELGRDALLPLGDRRSTPTIQRLLYDPAREQGLLIDVVALVPSDDSEEGKKEACVEVQVEDRSDRTRTLICSWRTTSTSTNTSPWNSILIEDDDVQVGPLQRGDSEVVTLRLSFTKSGVQQLPPLAVYDTSSGIEKILQGMQSIVV